MPLKWEIWKFSYEILVKKALNLTSLNDFLKTMLPFFSGRDLFQIF